MRGPSSSHCAATVRIGRLTRDLMSGEIMDAEIRFDRKSSLATTHKSQGSDMGILSGFLGWEAWDPRMIQFRKAIDDAGITAKFIIDETSDPHPNTYRMRLTNSKESHRISAISTGGGMFEIIEIDGIALSMEGDYYETLIYMDDDTNCKNVYAFVEKFATAQFVYCFEGDGQGKNGIIQIKSLGFQDDSFFSRLESSFGIGRERIKQLHPMLPVLSRNNIAVPYITCEEMLEFNRKKEMELWQLGAYYESIRGNISTDRVFRKMSDITGIMKQSIADGVEGKNRDYKDRILGYQSGVFLEKMQQGLLLDGGMSNLMILYTTAMMEVKSSMGIIVAAPTAGSCGALAGACFGAAHSMKKGDDEIVKAMLAGGMIGIFISSRSTFAAEVAGCQAECGAASGMAAAALVTLGGGTTKQAIAAASMALQNIFGMVCDPVANRVEVPCLGKNVMAASNALSCANMALAGYDPVMPLDEVIDAMDKVGKSIPCELRCTALGGLSITKTSKQIEGKLT